MSATYGVMAVCSVLVLLGLLQGWLGVEGYKPSTKCCSPDTWEARVVNTGTTHKQQLFYNNMDVKFVYDLPNNRWAIDHKHPTDASRDLKLVFSYDSGKRYAINHVGCYQEVLDVGLNPYCIGRNASFIGEFESGPASHAITLQAWSFDLFMYPLRQTVVVSKKNCIPIKEMTWSLIQNTFAWNEGEPACNPWEEQEVMIAGECYKSFREVHKEYHGTQPTAYYSNLDYVDVNLTISDESIFDVPKDCSEESWVGTVQSNDFWRILLMRMKYYDEDKDAPRLH